ncbi:MAG: DUF5677 domain-containing protein [Acidobacteriota bacterium]
MSDTSKWLSSLISLNKFDKIEIRPLVGGKFKLDQRDDCLVANYWRTTASVESILALNHVKHIQAIAGATRSLFEIAIDAALIDLVPRAPEKIVAFVEVEKMRSAHAIVRFKRLNPAAEVNEATFQEFVASEGDRITSLRDDLWPNRPDVKHWSLLKLEKRVEKVGNPFDEIYAIDYPRLSWYVHSGLTGFSQVADTHYHSMAGLSFIIATKSYMALMATIITSLRFDARDPRLKEKMLFAQMAPWTDGKEQVQQLKKELGFG